MTLKLADRVKETTSSTGSGTFNLAGAVTDFQSFIAGIGATNTTYYSAADGAGWEVGLGTVTSGSPNLLARTTVLASSNANNRVVFASAPVVAVVSPAALLANLLNVTGQTGTGPMVLGASPTVSGTFLVQNAPGTASVSTLHDGTNGHIKTLAGNLYFGAGGTDFLILDTAGRAALGSGVAVVSAASMALSGKPSSAVNTGFGNYNTVASGVTAYQGFLSAPVIVSGYTYPLIAGFYASGVPAVSGATVSGQIGFYANIVSGANNYAFYSPTTAASFFGGGANSTVGVFNGNGFQCLTNSGGGQISYYSNSVGQPNDHSWSHFVGQINNGGYGIIIYGSGDVINQNNSYGAISDIKLKQDIALANSQWVNVKALSDIVSKFHLKTNPDGPLQIGLIAQDVQKICPGLVTVTDDFEMVDVGEGEFVNKVQRPLGTQTLSLKYSVISIMMLKAMGEMMDRITALEATKAN